MGIFRPTGPLKPTGPPVASRICSGVAISSRAAPRKHAEASLVQLAVAAHQRRHRLAVGHVDKRLHQSFAGSVCRKSHTCCMVWVSGVFTFAMARGASAGSAITRRKSAISWLAA